jgi:hypothetical protein
MEQQTGWTCSRSRASLKPERLAILGELKREPPWGAGQRVPDPEKRWDSPRI